MAVKLLILDDAQIVQMLKNRDIVNRFPFMRAMAEQVRSGAATAICSPCTGPAPGSQPPNYAGLRAAIDSLPPHDKDQLKRMLGAERVRLYYKDHRQKVHKSTI